MKNGKFIKCKQCKKLFYIPKCRIFIRKFCSPSCSSLYVSKHHHRGMFQVGHSVSQKVRNKIGNANSGENSYTWKGGKFKTRSGYIMVLKKSHPYANANGYVAEHRLIMEEKIGRFMKHNEHIHHLNENRNDNRIENLELLDMGKHMSIHRKLEFENRMKDKTIYVKLYFKE